jgi:hypothetical protein
MGPNRRSRVVFASLLAVFLLTEAAGAAVRARFEQGKLSVTSAGALPAEVFAAIANETGVRFVIDRSLELPPLTFEVEATLERAIREIVAGLPGVAGHAMVHGASAAGGSRLVEVSVFGAGGPRAPAVAYVRRAGPEVLARVEGPVDLVNGEVPPETEAKIRGLIGDLQAVQASSLGRKDLPPESLPRLEVLVEAGFPEKDAIVALVYVEKRRMLMEELAKIPGGEQAFNVVKFRPYYRPRPANAGPPSVFGD